MTRQQIEAEQKRRLAEQWRASTPSNDEVDRARARLAFRGARRARSPFKMLIVALVQGFLLGGATLAAAAWFTGRGWPLFEHRAATVTPPAEHAPMTRAHRSGAPTAVVEVHEQEDAPGAIAAYPPAETSEAAARPGAAVSPRTRSAAPSEHDEVLAKEPEPAPVHPDEAAEAPPAPPDGPWTRVARALSASDWQQADAALVELMSTADPATRDAAELARAELFIAHGRGDALRPSVERLAHSGYSPLIRKRATRLLERLPLGEASR
jgi:hypothetical protein